MGEHSASLNDGDARYAGRTRVNRAVYEFTQDDLSGNTSVTADIALNGQVNNIILDATRSKLTTNTNSQVHGGSFQLLYADLADGAGSALQLPYHEVISNLDYTTASPRPYKFQTAEGAAVFGAAQMPQTLVVRAGVSGHSGTAEAPKTLNAQGAATLVDDVVPWTGMVCGKVRIELKSGTAWASDTGSIFVVIVYN
tara:strand:+ start:1963 stop:2553 length:591 start_codon:yes stop_codon:yes gene_type:complete